MQTADPNRPLVTVILPAFNAERTIRTAIESAVAQTHDLVEIIVCDDASADATCAAVESLGCHQVRLIRHDENLGPGASRDSAIAQAKGEWLALLDADDAWAPDRIRKLLAASNSVDIVFDDIAMCLDGPGPLSPIGRLHGSRAFGGDGSATDVPLAEYLGSQRLLIQPMLRARAVRKAGVVHSNRRFGEDAEFYIRLSLQGLRMRYVPEPLYFYRIRPGSLTSDARERGAMRTMLLDFLSDVRMPPEALAALRLKIEGLELDARAYEAIDMLKRGEIRNAARLVAANPGVLGSIAGRLPRRTWMEFRRLARRSPRQ